MPLITRTYPPPAGRREVVVTAVETSLCDASVSGAWTPHDLTAHAPHDATTWTIKVPVTAAGEYLRIRETLLVDGETAIDAHRVAVPDHGAHQLADLPRRD